MGLCRFGGPKRGGVQPGTENWSMGLVYVIENEPGLRDSLVEALGQMPGVQAYGFELLHHAVDVLESHPPDLILTELNLPEPGFDCS